MTKEEFNEMKSFGDIFNKALELAREGDKEKTSEFRELYISYILENADDVATREMAEKRMSDNFGYYAGYYGDSVRKMMQKYYGAVHPVFGNCYDVTPKEAYECGYHHKKLNRD